MTDLSPEVLPSVWSLIRNSLVDAPRIKRADLVERLTPHGLIAREEGGTDDSRHVKPSLDALIAIGVVEADGQGSLELAKGVSTESEFRRLVTARLFDVGSEEESEVWRMRTELQPEHHAELGLAWLHLQGVMTPISNFRAAETHLQHQFGAARVLLRDGAPYNSLERLARWCGVATDVAAAGGSAIIPDPTQAIRAELDNLIEAGSEVPARAIVDRIAAIFNWLPNGAVGRAVAARMSDVPDTSVGRGSVPEGVSLALIQLHLEGLIELIAGDDAADRVTLTPGGFTGPSGTEVSAVARIRRPRATK
jgi:hypothetical protein